MFRKLVSSITVVIALLFGVSVIYSSGSLAKERGNPSDCAKIKDIEEKKECVKSAMEELKEGKKDRDKDDDKDDDKGKKDKKSKKDKKKKKKSKKKKGRKNKD